MCSCTWEWTCHSCQGTRFEGSEAWLVNDPEKNDPLEADQDVRPAEYEVSER